MMLEGEVMQVLDMWCRESDSNRHDPFGSQDFKSFRATLGTTRKGTGTRAGSGVSVKPVSGYAGAKNASQRHACHNGVTRSFPLPLARGGRP